MAGDQEYSPPPTVSGISNDRHALFARSDATRPTGDPGAWIKPQRGNARAGAATPACPYERATGLSALLGWLHASGFDCTEDTARALALLRGVFAEDDTVRVDARDGAIVFGK